MDEPVLVTGASGFIGGRLARRLIELHGRVSCLVRDSSRVDELQAAGARLIPGDVTDRSSVERALAESRARTVFHLAGLVKAQRWGAGKDDFKRVNAGGVENVAAACANRAGPPVLIVVSSLAAVGPSASDQLHVEADLPSPVSNYGHSKLAGEQAAAKYAGAVPITIVRPPIVFGPGDRGVLEMFRPIARWGVHFVPGCRGERCFSLIHVEELVDGLLLAADNGERLPEHSSAGEGIYFIARDDRPTYAQLGQAIAQALAQKAPVIMRLPGPLLRLAGICGDVAARIRRQPGWVSGDKIAEALAGSWTCSAAKARAHLGWAPTGTLGDHLRATAQWYRQAGWL